MKLVSNHFDLKFISNYNTYIHALVLHSFTLMFKFMSCKHNFIKFFYKTILLTTLKIKV